MAQYDELYIDQGSTFDYTIELDNPLGGDFNLTSYDVRASLRRSYKSSVATSFVISFPEGKSAGRIKLNLTDESTETLKHGHYVFDVIVESSGGEIYRVVEGIAFINPRVTV
jgi:hypothetical protein